MRNYLGLVLATLGDYAAAREQIEAAIHIGEATLPADHPDRGRRNLNNLVADQQSQTREPPDTDEANPQQAS